MASWLQPFINMYRLLAAVWGIGSIFSNPQLHVVLKPIHCVGMFTPLKTCGSVKLCSKPSILRTVASREIFTHSGEKSKPLSLLELAQLVLYSPPSSLPLDLLSSRELRSLHLAFLSLTAFIKITSNADYGWYAQALP